MFHQHSDLGAAHFKTWSDEQKREEIKKLVDGYRAGLPLGILCKMAETVAGSPELAISHLHSFMSESERRQAIEGAAGGIKQIAEEFLGPIRSK